MRTPHNIAGWLHGFVTAAGLMLVMPVAAGAAHAATRAVDRQPTTLIAMNFYYAKPGKADEVYRWRLHASDVRARLGYPRGRVLRRVGKHSGLADVIWECDYPSREVRARDYAAINAEPEFQAVERHMETLLTRFRASAFEVQATP